jgi:fructose-1,6-bisphosphatase/inositol monophosphatase family enzyme
VDGGGGEAEAGSILHPYTVEVYVAVDGSDVCLSLTSSEGVLRTERSREGSQARAEFKRYETYEDKTREVYRPKGLLAYATAAREYVRML